MIATIALLATLGALASADAPAPSTVWVVAEPAAEATIAQVSNELRALGCEVRDAPLDGPPETVAERLLGEERLLSDARSARALVVIVFASPVPMEVWWWSDAADGLDYELLRRAVTSDEARLDAVRVAEAVRARLALAATVRPVVSRAPPPATLADEPTQADPALVLRLAVGPTLSGHVEAESAAGLALSLAVALSQRTAAVLNLNLPIAAVDWNTWNGTAQTRDYVVAALIEGRMALPLSFELRGAAGLSFHTRVSQGVAPADPVSYRAGSTAFAVGPALATGIAYRIRDTFGLVATAAADATYPDQDVIVGYSQVAFPGHLLWTLGLLGEVEF